MTNRGDNPPVASRPQAERVDAFLDAVSAENPEAILMLSEFPYMAAVLLKLADHSARTVDEHSSPEELSRFMLCLTSYPRSVDIARHVARCGECLLFCEARESEARAQVLRSDAEIGRTIADKAMEWLGLEASKANPSNCSNQVQRAVPEADWPATIVSTAMSAITARFFFRPVLGPVEGFTSWLVEAANENNQVAYRLAAAAGGEPRARFRVEAEGEGVIFVEGDHQHKLTLSVRGPDELSPSAKPPIVLLVSNDRRAALKVARYHDGYFEYEVEGADLECLCNGAEVLVAPPQS